MITSEPSFPHELILESPAEPSVLVTVISEGMREVALAIPQLLSSLHVFLPKVSGNEIGDAKKLVESLQRFSIGGWVTGIEIDNEKWVLRFIIVDIHPLSGRIESLRPLSLQTPPIVLLSEFKASPAPVTTEIFQLSSFRTPPLCITPNDTLPEGGGKTDFTICNLFNTLRALHLLHLAFTAEALDFPRGRPFLSKSSPWFETPSGSIHRPSPITIVPFPNPAVVSPSFLSILSDAPTTFKILNIEALVRYRRKASMGGS